ncbi:RNA polymerase sigma factor [Sphingomonas koreensis]
MCFRKLVQQLRRGSWSPEPHGYDDRAPERDLRRRYRAAVETLPDLQREVFWRHRIDGQPLAEIAAALGLPSAEVEGHLSCALVAISDALDPLDAD